ncbi:MAG: hypothetical protein IMW89_05040, partial [Ktedonobacteraceae bacterium]|nr:hypothetical protein [Ktedonobacteraceae bacterium]
MKAGVSRKQERLHALERQIARIERLVELLTQRRHHLLLIQLWIILAGTAISLVICRLLSWLAFVCVLIVVGLFVYSWWKRRKVQSKIERYTIWLRVKKTHIARMRLDWEHIPPVEDEYEADHPFERDLDISGYRSLHQLVNTACSDEGRKRLRQWLLTRIPDP